MAPLRKGSDGFSSTPDRRRIPRRDVDRWSARRARELEAAIEISQALFEHLGIDELIEDVLRTALKVVNAEAGSILMAESESKSLVFRYVIRGKDKLIGTCIPWDQGIAGAVFQSGEPEIVSNAKQDPRHLADIGASFGYATHDMIVLPLKRWEGQSIGVLEVLNKRDGRLDEEDAVLLTIVCAFAAMAIEQARLYEETKLAEVVRLLGDISHDIKNLLMPVVTGERLLDAEIKELFAKMSKTKAKDASKSRALCKEILGMLRDATRRIQDRMKEIADCVKGLSAPPQFAPCRLADLVESVAKTLGISVADKKILLRMEGLTDLPPIQADERRLFNAFYNLINNAIEEVSQGGSITVRGREVPTLGMIKVSVADTGRGMPPDVLKSLFSASTISRKPGGTGLGTKIIKDVVDAHHGKISVESEEGAGTTFYISLPLHPPGTKAQV